MSTPEFSLPHLLRQPQTASDSPPLLILLHGVGSNEQDLFGLAPYLDPRFVILSVRAPLTVMRGEYAWFEVRWIGNRPIANLEQAESSRKKIVDFIPQAVDAYHADPGRVYLLGFSQGAIMSASVMLTQPELLAGVAALSGRILPEARAATVPPERLDGFPVLVQHGIKDQVLSIDYGRDSRDFLSTLPVDLTYREYEMGHQITDESMLDLTTWLAARLDGKPTPETG